MRFEEAKKNLEKKQICGRRLDNEPKPMNGCNCCDCEGCELEVTKFVAVEDIEAVLGDLHHAWQKTVKPIKRIEFILRHIRANHEGNYDRQKAEFLFNWLVAEGYMKEKAEKLLREE